MTIATRRALIRARNSFWPRLLGVVVLAAAVYAAMAWAVQP